MLHMTRELRHKWRKMSLSFANRVYGYKRWQHVVSADDRRAPRCSDSDVWSSTDEARSGLRTKTSLGRTGVNPEGASFVSALRRMKGIIGPERTGDEIVFCIRWFCVEGRFLVYSSFKVLDLLELSSEVRPYSGILLIVRM